jgi:superfamily II DNA or RNA helicase
LHGEDPIELRREYIDLMRTQQTKILIASRIFNAGIDVPLVRCIVRMGGDQSEISSLQIPGRGMRRKEEFNWLYLIDFNDRTSKYFHDHSRRRLRVYADEGYELTPITDIEDIPFVGLEDEDSSSNTVPRKRTRHSA